MLVTPLAENLRLGDKNSCMCERWPYIPPRSGDGTKRRGGLPSAAFFLETRPETHKAKAQVSTLKG
jgi:hypothetical protein